LQFDDCSIDEQSHKHISSLICSGSLNLAPPAPLYLQTFNSCINVVVVVVVIIIIIIIICYFMIITVTGFKYSVHQSVVITMWDRLPNLQAFDKLVLR